MKPLFYAVRRITRGPRGAVKHTEIVRTVITSKSRAIAHAKSCKKYAYSWQDVEAIAVRSNSDKIEFTTVWSSRGR